MNSITILRDVFEPSTWEDFAEVESLEEFLFEHFPSGWPQGAKLYYGQVSDENDVTPMDERGVEKLKTLQGKFYICLFPQVEYIVYAVIAVVAFAAATLLFKPPNVTARNTNVGSPNNELAQRTNEPRPNKRIPDPYGTGTFTPDLIAAPYKVFVNNQEVEYIYACVGRGEYEFSVNGIRDDTTKIKNIPQASVKVFGPNTSPNFGSPQLTVGPSFSEPILNVKRYTSVNGQVLKPYNASSINGNNNIRFVSPNVIETTGFNFSELYESGDLIDVYDAVLGSILFTESYYMSGNATGVLRFKLESASAPPGYHAGRQITLVGAVYSIDGEFGSTYYNLNGTYEISSATVTTVGSEHFYDITLVDPEAVNAAWASAIPTAFVFASVSVYADSIDNLSGTYEIQSVSSTQIALVDPEVVNPTWSTITTTNYLSPKISLTADRWVGGFIVDALDTTHLLCNFVSDGMYKDDGRNQVGATVEVQVEATPIDLDDEPTGAPSLYFASVVGNATDQESKNTTLRITLPAPGRYSVRARRLTPKDTAFQGTVNDTVRWRDLYGASTVTVPHFGNVSTVQARIPATAGALAIKDRKLNLRGTRKVPQRTGSTFGSLVASDSVADIFCAVALDPYIGSRTVAELDLDNIYDTVADVVDYFGFPQAAHFSYTFDSDTLSAEDTLAAIANAAFCVSYRRGNKFRLSFEKETDDATLLFNHRNKVPRSERRQVRFGTEDGVDGVAFNYIDPVDDSVQTIYIPAGRTAVKEKRIESIGIRGYQQAFLHAARAWNKIQYAHTNVSFTGLIEAELLVRNDAILLSDNTISGTQDGEVKAQDGLLLTLSQKFEPEPGVNYTIFLQLADATTQAIDITATDNKYKVVLAEPPRLSLVTGDDRFAKTGYIIVGDDNPDTCMYLFTGRGSTDGLVCPDVTCINYDARYYQNDMDFA